MDQVMMNLEYSITFSVNFFYILLKETLQHLYQYSQKTVYKNV